MAFKPRDVAIFRDTSIIFRNFAGEAKKYNKLGDRNFSVVLDENTARELEKAGWNVKPLKRHEEDDEQLYHMKVKVSFANRPPRCWLISSGGRTLMDEGMVGMLDMLDSARVDVQVTAYDWTLDSGASGRTAYLESLFFTVYESELEKEYAHIPQTPGISARVPDDMPREIESGARRPYDIDGEIDE